MIHRKDAEDAEGIFFLLPLRGRQEKSSSAIVLLVPIIFAKFGRFSAFV
jgi:hypothetical protein